MLINPYETLPEEEIQRTTIKISKRDEVFLHSLHGRKGTLQTTLNILLHLLVEQLKQNNITQYDPDRYEKYINGTIVTISPGVGSTAANQQPHRQADSGDDRRGVASVARVDTRAPAQSSNAVSAPAKQSGKKQVPVRRAAKA